MKRGTYAGQKMEASLKDLPGLSTLTGCPSESRMVAASQVIQNSSRSFSLAVRFMPAGLRDQVIALYAWCRCVDDTVDRATNDQTAALELQTLDEDIQRSSAGQALQHPASAWIHPLIASRAIDPRHACELIEGMRMDIRCYRIDTDADLECYCYHAAGTVGLMLTQMMGVQERAADRHAIALGLAMQLTNIARDVREDAQRGRSYLPGILLPLESDRTELKTAVAHILKTAEQHYRTAAQGLHYLPWNCRLAIRVALTVYREIGRQIQREGYEVLHKRTVISRPRLILVSMVALFASLADDVRTAAARLQPSLTLSLKELMMNNHPSSQSTAQASTPAQAKQTVFLGLSLTLIMATALFTMVFFHPKSTEYSLLPLIYAGVCLLGSIVFHRLSASTSDWTSQALPSNRD